MFFFFRFFVCLFFFVFFAFFFCHVRIIFFQLFVQCGICFCVEGPGVASVQGFTFTSHRAGKEGAKLALQLDITTRHRSRTQKVAQKSRPTNGLKVARRGTAWHRTLRRSTTLHGVAQYSMTYP